MEKRAVVVPGHTPSIESGKKSVFVKNGNAFAGKENADDLRNAEAELEKNMRDMYTGDR